MAVTILLLLLALQLCGSGSGSHIWLSLIFNIPLAPAPCPLQDAACFRPNDIASSGGPAASPTAHFTQDDMRLISENLDVLLKSKTPAGQHLLMSIPAAPAPLVAGGGDREDTAGPRLLCRSRSVELPDALLARPGSPFLHRVERPQLKHRQAGTALGAMASSGLALVHRSSSSPLLNPQQQQPQRPVPEDGQTESHRQEQKGGAAHSITISVDASAGSAAAAAAAGGVRRLTSNQSEATGGGGNGAGGGAGGAPDDLDWLLKHPASAAEAREFDMLFGGAAGSGGGAMGGDTAAALLVAGGAGGAGQRGVYSPSAGLLFSPREHTGIFSPRYKIQ